MLAACRALPHRHQPVATGFGDALFGGSERGLGARPARGTVAGQGILEAIEGLELAQQGLTVLRRRGADGEALEHVS